MNVSTFLMFENGVAEEAMNLYVSLIPNSRVVSVNRWPKGSPGVEGKVMTASFVLAGADCRCSDTYVSHGFTFTPSTSFFIDCDSEQQLDQIFATLLEGGKALMAPGNYGFSQKFGWLQDRYGVSWQINLP